MIQAASPSLLADLMADPDTATLRAEPYALDLRAGRGGQAHRGATPSYLERRATCLRGDFPTGVDGSHAMLLRVAAGQAGMDSRV